MPCRHLPNARSEQAEPLQVVKADRKQTALLTALKTEQKEKEMLQCFGRKLQNKEKKSSPPPAHGLEAIRNEGSWWEGCQLPPIHSAFLPFSKGSVTASPWVLRTWTAEVMLQRRMAPACRCPPLVTPTCWWCPVLCQRPPGRAEPGLAGWSLSGAASRSSELTGCPGGRVQALLSHIEDRGSVML